MMTKVFKEHLSAACDKWLGEIKASGVARIDMHEEYERLFAHTINYICFGEDHNHEYFDFNVYDNQTRTF